MPKKILLIDDEGDILRVVTSRLKKAGYEVVTAKNGLEGLRKIESENPDLVVTDFNIPKMNGNELIRHFKSNPKYKHIPVIVFSAYLHTLVLEGKKTPDVPADALVPKPFQPNDLIGTIKTLLNE